MKKKAFTLFETLIVLAIVALLVLLTLKIFKNADEKAYGDLYAKAYNTLNTATYNIQLKVEEHNDLANLEAQREGSSSASDSDLLRFPNVAKNVTNPTDAQLCAELTSLEEGFINTISDSCGTSANNTNMMNNIIPKNPTFRATDGMKYYLATPAGILDFYYIWVDINGDRGPNSTKYVMGKKRPDIVPFLISKENGIVVPQGYPTYDITYLKARVLSADPDLEKDYSIPMTFYEAQSIAYSGKTWTLDPLSAKVDFDKTFPSNLPKPTPSTTIKNSLKCDSSSYTVTRDFPPCAVEVSVFMRK